MAEFSSFNEIQQAVDAGETVGFGNGFTVKHFSNGYFVVHKCGITAGTIECHPLESFTRKPKGNATLTLKEIAQSMGMKVIEM